MLAVTMASHFFCGNPTMQLGWLEAGFLTKSHAVSSFHFHAFDGRVSILS